MKNRRRSSKNHESRVAEKLNGIRVGILGKEDVITDRFSVECKVRKAFVGAGWFEQAKRNAKGKIPIVVVHVRNKRYDDDLVIISMKDFITITGGDDHDSHH